MFSKASFFPTYFSILVFNKSMGILFSCAMSKSSAIWSELYSESFVCCLHSFIKSPNDFNVSRETWIPFSSSLLIIWASLSRCPVTVDSGESMK